MFKATTDVCIDVLE